MPILQIAGNGPRVGQTALACGLARHLASKGHSVVVGKTISMTSGPDPDIAIYRILLGQREDIDLQINVMTQGSGVDLRPEKATRLESILQGLDERHDLVIIEGLTSEVRKDLGFQNSPALAQTFQIPTILVVGFDSSLNPEELVRGIQELTGNLVGCIINGVTRYKHREVEEDLIPALLKEGIPVLGWIPEHRSLLGITVSSIVQTLGGRYLCGEEASQVLVEHLLLGAQVLDSGVDYFNQAQKKAVLVRGDRPDIQMAALQTSVACLVLTTDSEPSEYVLYEAQEQGVSLIQTPHSTIEAARLLETIALQSHFNHPQKLQVMTSLVGERLALDAISMAIGL